MELSGMGFDSGVRRVTGTSQSAGFLSNRGGPGAYGLSFNSLERPTVWNISSFRNQPAGSSNFATSQEILQNQAAMARELMGYPVNVQSFVDNRSSVFQFLGSTFNSETFMMKYPGGLFRQILAGISGNEGAWDLKEWSIMNQVWSDPKAAAEFSKMSPEDQNKYLELCKQDFSEQSTLEKPSGVNPALIKILAGGKMTRKDCKGNTLLDNLKNLKSQEFREGVDGGKIYNQVVENIANPKRIHQGNKNTCTVTTIEMLHAGKDPADYARVVAGLTGEKGGVQLRSGKILRANATSFEEDGSGRSAVDRIYQASLMEFADEKRFYNNKSDSQAEIKISFKGGLGSWLIPIPDVEVEEKKGGLTANQFVDVMNNVLPVKSELVKYNPEAGTESKMIAEANMQSALSDKKPVTAVLMWNQGGEDARHRVLVEKITGDAVIIRNPQGGVMQIPKEEFFKNLRGYSIPEGAAVARDPEQQAWYSNAEYGSFAFARFFVPGMTAGGGNGSFWIPGYSNEHANAGGNLPHVGTPEEPVEGSAGGSMGSSPGGSLNGNLSGSVGNKPVAGTDDVTTPVEKPIDYGPVEVPPDAKDDAGQIEPKPDKPGETVKPEQKQEAADTAKDADRQRKEIQEDQKAKEAEQHKEAIETQKDEEKKKVIEKSIEITEKIKVLTQKIVSVETEIKEMENNLEILLIENQDNPDFDASEILDKIEIKRLELERLKTEKEMKKLELESVKGEMVNDADYELESIEYTIFKEKMKAARLDEAHYRASSAVSVQLNAIHDRSADISKAQLAGELIRDGIDLEIVEDVEKLKILIEQKRMTGLVNAGELQREIMNKLN